MDEAGILLADQAKASGRWAMLVDEGDSIWLLLTDPEDGRPVADVWVANTLDAPDAPDLAHYREQGKPPPAPAGMVGENACVRPDAPVTWALIWNEDGEGLTAYLDGEVRATLDASGGPGACTALRHSGPWGRPLEPGEAGPVAEGGGG